MTSTHRLQRLMGFIINPVCCVFNIGPSLHSPPEPPGGPAGAGPLPPHRADQASGGVPPGHGQHHRPEDPGASLRQEEAGADGHPQEWAVILPPHPRVKQSSPAFSWEDLLVSVGRVWLITVGRMGLRGTTACSYCKTILMLTSMFSLWLEMLLYFMSPLKMCNCLK